MISETMPNPATRIKKTRTGTQLSSMLANSRNVWTLLSRLALTQTNDDSQPSDTLSMVGSACTWPRQSRKQDRNGPENAEKSQNIHLISCVFAPLCGYFPVVLTSP